MSRRVALVASGSAPLQSFASSLITKVTGNAVSLAPGAADAETVGIAVAEVPVGAHTVITEATETKPALYKDVSAVFVRAVLPAPVNSLPLRDLVDVYPLSGIKIDSELALVKASFAKTAATAVKLAKARGNKITVFVKEVSKHEQLNNLFKEALEAATNGTNIAIDYVGSAHVVNTLIMAPETLGVVAAADTTVAENAEMMYSGLMGGVARTYCTDEGSVLAGHSYNSVTFAVAGALRALGLTAEAKKLENAAAKAKANDEGAAILAAL